MAVFVTELRYYRTCPRGYRGHAGGGYWCHLLADTVKELHAFATRLGLRRQWFQDHRYSHYDLLAGRRSAALRAGAIECTTRDWIRRCRSKQQ